MTRTACAERCQSRKDPLVTLRLPPNRSSVEQSFFRASAQPVEPYSSAGAQLASDAGVCRRLCAAVGSSKVRPQNIGSLWAVMKVPTMMLDYTLRFGLAIALGYIYWDPKSTDEIRSEVVRGIA